MHTTRRTIGRSNLSAGGDRWRLFRPERLIAGGALLCLLHSAWAPISRAELPVVPDSQLVNCDPSALADAARCFSSCHSKGTQRAVRSYLLCQIATRCVPSAAPSLSAAVVSNFTTITFHNNPAPDAPPIINGIIIYYGTQAGGPYPNKIVYPHPNLNTGPHIGINFQFDNLNQITTYYFIARYYTSSPICLSPPSNEVSATTGGIVPPGNNHILTEGGDILATENGLELVTEN